MRLPLVPKIAQERSKEKAAHVTLPERQALPRIAYGSVTASRTWSHCIRRSTVYRHFPDEAALFDACSAHWAAANPLPQLDIWSAIENPDERLGIALAELYTFYRQTEPMLDNLFRDETTTPLIQERFADFRGYIDAARDTLMTGRSLRGAARRRTQAALGHAIAFSTWKSLVREQRLDDSDGAALVRALVAAAS